MTNPFLAIILRTNSEIADSHVNGPIAWSNSNVRTNCLLAASYGCRNVFSNGFDNGFC